MAVPGQTIIDSGAHEMIHTKGTGATVMTSYLGTLSQSVMNIINLTPIV